MQKRRPEVVLMLGPWRTIVLAIVAIGGVLVVLALNQPESVSAHAIDTIAMIAGGGALYRYLADRGKAPGSAPKGKGGGDE